MSGRFFEPIARLDLQTTDMRCAGDRTRSSLDGVQGREFASEAQIRAMAAKALGQGVILFLRADLQRLPWASREIIETEARKLYGEKR